MNGFFFLLCPPALTVLHQSGEIGEVCAETHHTFVTVQSEQHAGELGEISVKEFKKPKSQG